MHVFLSFYLCIYSQQYTTIIHLIILEFSALSWEHISWNSGKGTGQQVSVYAFVTKAAVYSWSNRFAKHYGLEDRTIFFPV